MNELIIKSVLLAFVVLFFFHLSVIVLFSFYSEFSEYIILRENELVIIEENG